ncbi:unnamed protein product [Penicillium manginii]
MPRVNTTPQKVLGIEDALVSDENPACNGWKALHKQDTPDLDALASEKWLFRQAGEEIASIRSRLIPPLNSFLDLIYESKHEFFYWVDSLVLMPCDEYVIDSEDRKLEKGKERFVLIYHTQDTLGSHNLGVIYDQQRNRLSFSMTTDNRESLEPIYEHEEMWLLLETIVTYWIRLVQIGKIVAGIPDKSSFDELGFPTDRPQFNLLALLPYCDFQVESTITAMERYSDIIESRMSPDSLLSISSVHALPTDAELDAADVPNNGFTAMVESGIWTVGDDGVEGGIDKFSEADFGDGFEYSIEPSW